MMTISIIKSLVSLGSFVGVNIRMHDNKELRLRYYVVAQAQVPVEVRVLGTSNQANAGLCKGSEVLTEYVLLLHCRGSTKLYNIT